MFLIVDYKITAIFYQRRGLAPREKRSFMGPLDLINHLVNFAAAPSFVAIFLALFAPYLLKKSAFAPVLYAQAAINLGAGVLALLLGLWFFGRDAKMASYGFMLVAMASSQWVMLGGARAGK